METFITIIHIAVALFMILVVLVQGGNSGGIGAAFGGGNSQGFFGASGATSFLGKVTYGAAAVFMITSITLSVFSGTSGKTGLKERIEQQTGGTPEADKTTEPDATPAATGTETQPQEQPASGLSEPETKTEESPQPQE